MKERKRRLPHLPPLSQYTGDTGPVCRPDIHRFSRLEPTKIFEIKSMKFHSLPGLSTRRYRRNTLPSNRRLIDVFSVLYTFKSLVCCLGKCVLKVKYVGSTLTEFLAEISANRPFTRTGRLNKGVRVINGRVSLQMARKEE